MELQHYRKAPRLPWTHCVYCGKKLPRKPKSSEHVPPDFRYECDDPFTVPACVGCNVELSEDDIEFCITVCMLGEHVTEQRRAFWDRAEPVRRWMRRLGP